MKRALWLALSLSSACIQVSTEAETREIGVDPPAPEPVEGIAVAHPSGAALAWVRANTCEDAAALSLTASDGTGLRLTSLQAHAFVEGPIALTELELTFDNPEARIREGRFSITLPPGAALSRFAMDIDGRWQEGEVVERQRARQVYEDFLHKRQDPALMEADAGNVFSARVFPIPASGRKKLVVAYSQRLESASEPFRLPVCGLPQLDELDVDVAFADRDDAAKVEHLTLHEEGFSATMDLEARPGRQVDGVRAGELAIVRVRARIDTPPMPLAGLTILFDTSASRGLDFRGQVDRLGILIEEIARRDPGLPLHVVAFDQTISEVFDGPARAFGTIHRRRILRRGPLGASDLEAALTAIRTRDLASPRVLLVGDGVATAGDTQAAALTVRARELEAAGVDRIDALVDGSVSNPELLLALVASGLPHDGVVLDARMKLETVVDKLEHETRSGIAVRVPGATWVHPAELDRLQSGDDRLVYVRLPADRDVTVELDGARVEVATPSLAPAPATLVERAHAEARIEALTAAHGLATDAARRDALAAEIVAESVAHRVISDFTSLLVLETEQDYARYQIDRDALAEILTVGPKGVAVVTREPPPVETAAPAPRPTATGTRVAEGSPVGGSDVGGDADRALTVYDFEDDDVDGELLTPQAPGGRHVDEMRRLEPEANRIAAPQPQPRTTRPPAASAPRRARSSRSTTRRRARRSSGGRIGRRSRRAALRRERTHNPFDTGAEGGLPPPSDPWDGRFAKVMGQLRAGHVRDARKEAQRWRATHPGDVLAFVALGETLEAAGDPTAAARAYGSLIDLYPSRADIRRMAGERLERLARAGDALALDTYAKALAQRPDHLSGYRLLAYGLVKAGQPGEAFAVLAEGLDRPWRSDRYAGVRQILRADLELVAAAWLAEDPGARAEIDAGLARNDATLADTPSTRFVLTWETDANDVDLHVTDAHGDHAYYRDPVLPSGGDLYADVTTGYGPECFAIEGEATAGPYRLQAHYYRRGPMGYGMGKVQVVIHDGAGHLAFVEHPFVIMRDDAYVDLATYDPRRRHG